MDTNKKGSRTKTATKIKQVNYNTSIMLMVLFLTFILLGIKLDNHTCIAIGYGIAISTVITVWSEMEGHDHDS